MPRSHSASRYIPELDGIRGIAILLVISVHMHSEAWAALRGNLGVVLFFVLSGYLITSIALHEEADTGGVSLSAFYIRRAFRIFPLYYLVLALHCVLIFEMGFAPDRRAALWKAMPYYLFYFQEIFAYGKRMPSGNVPFTQSWTLGIEEKFYLVWPFLAFFALRFKRNLRLPVAFIFILVLSFGGKFFYFYDCILCGCALALALDKPSVCGAVKSFGSKGVWLSLSAVVLLHAFGAPGPEVVLDLVYSVAAACLIGFMLSVRTPLNRIFAWRPLAFTGKVSYGIYLIHRICLDLAERLMHDRPLPSLIATIILSLAGAWVLHITIEKPLIDVGRKLATRYKRPTSQVRLASAVNA